MSGEHTPGPWAVSKRGARRVTTTKGVVICNAVLRNSGSPKRGIKHGAKEMLEAEANARLIAASPKLLRAAIYAVMQMAEGDDPELDEEGEEICPFALLREAIAEATGQ